jgi:hypothetical protein
MAQTERENMISSDEAFSIFRKWQEESSSVELLTGSVQDAPTLKPPRRLARVVDVYEPKEIVLVVEGKRAHRASVDLCGASFEYADPRETSEPASQVWVCFIEAKLPSGERWLFGERNRF